MERYFNVKCSHSAADVLQSIRDKKHIVECGEMSEFVSFIETNELFRKLAAESHFCGANQMDTCNQ